MLYEVAKTLALPDWCPEESRFWHQYVNNSWLDLTQYAGIRPSFRDEMGPDKRPLKMFDKRPSVRLQLPAIGAGIIKNKLFSPGRFPQIIHDNPAVIEAVKWFIKATELDIKMMDSAYWGQAGSVGVGIKIIDEMPVLTGYKGHQCTPRFDQRDQLERLDIHQRVKGRSLLTLEMTTDREGDPVVPEEDYWYIRMIDKDAVFTCMPILFDAWNPVDNDPYDEPTHSITEHDVDLPFPMAVWIRNGGVRIGPDGMSTYALALPNCIALDYTLSQLQRGINAAAVPTVVIKGRLLHHKDGAPLQVGPNSMIQLEPDLQEGNGMGRSGSDAKYLEMSGAGVSIGLQHWAYKMVHWTKDSMSISTKDPDTIQGAISGKALEIINELPLDAIKVQQLAYGNYGLVPIIQKGGKALIATNHPKFKGVTPEMLDEIELKQQAFYPSTATEAAPLVTSLMTAVAGGMMHKDVASTHLHSEMGVDASSIEDDKDKKQAEDGRQMALEALGKAPKPEPVAKPKPKPAK